MRGRLCAGLVTLVFAFGGLVGMVPRSAAADPSLPSLTVGDVSVWEGNAGSLVVKVPVDLSVVPSSIVTVFYAVTSDGASAGSDFVAHTGKLVFKPGLAPTKFVLVKVDGDTVNEPDEHVLVHITSVSGANVEKGDGGVTILNDDDGTSGPGVTVGIGDVTVVEADSGKHVASVPVTLSVPAPTTIKVLYSVSCGTANPGQDYSEPSRGLLTFLPNQQTKYINIAIRADNVPEVVVKQVIDNIQVVLGPAVVRTSESRGDTTILDNDGSGLPQPGEIQRVNVASNGDQAEPPPASICDSGGVTPYSGIWGEAISRNGRYVAFGSSAGNLVDGDTNGTMDVFVRDLQTQTTERVSLKPDGSEFTTSNPWGGGSYTPSISADGRYVTFYNGTDNTLYLRDRVAGTTQRISVAGVGGEGNASISDDGRYVTYQAYWDQVPGNTSPEINNTEAAYLWDRDTDTTTLIADGAISPVISGDGRYVAFTDIASDLVPGDTNNCSDVFVRDLQTGTTERVSVTSDGAEQQPNASAGQCSDPVPTISRDGRFVGFSSAAWNMYPGGTGSDPLTSHAYLRDRLLGTTEIVDTDNPGNWAGFNAMSDDGRYVLYSCSCGDPIPLAQGAPGQGDFVSMWLDRQTGVTLEVGVQPDGTPPIDEDYGWFTDTIAWGGVSGDGHTVAFVSTATNLVPDDSNGAQDAFVQRFG
jgi:hypothetical protein